MRILWLTETPTDYDSENLSYNGRGWISSLQKLIEKSLIISELAIAFPHEKDSVKVNKGKTTYYPIKKILPSGFLSWVKLNWENNIEFEQEMNALKSVLSDFKPDIIHVFGTESWFLNVVSLTSIPCIVHIQGLLAPISNTYYPHGISTQSIILSDLVSYFRGNSIWHYKRVLDKKALRELALIKNVEYFMGRTNWDKSISTFLSSKSNYFHIDEVLRESFYNASKYEVHKNNHIIITSTISNAPYKGLDLIIKSAKLLKLKKFDFEWKIIGINDNQSFTKYLKSKENINYQSINVKLLGVKNETEIIDILLTSSFYVHSSYIDNSPNSICEAQILGLPVIATNVGGVSSLIEDDKDGFLVPANDPYFLAAEIYRLHNQTKKLSEISINSRSKALKRHSKELIIEQLMSTYNTILGQ